MYIHRFSSLISGSCFYIFCCFLPIALYREDVAAVGRRKGKNRDRQKPEASAVLVLPFSLLHSYPFSGRLPVRRRRICYVLGLSGSNWGEDREEFGVGGAYFRIFSPGSRFSHPDTKFLSRIYTCYFRNTNRYISPSPAEYAVCVQLILGKSSGMFYNRKEKLCSGGQKE